MNRGQNALPRIGAALAALVASAAVVASCASKDEGAPTVQRLTEEQLMDPEACKGCHPSQFREWSGSMHAYAGEDPLFIAMNARMARLTGGAQGNFCAQCHAPVAVRLGLTTDGQNLATLPPKLRGVTCFFCHASAPGPTEFNNPLVLQHDGVMQGGIKNPVPTGAHLAAYSRNHDREAPEGVSSITCGPCHDITTSAGAPIERTFSEWTDSIYTGNSLQAASCSQCHMPSRVGVAANVPGVFLRRVHDHSMPGVDTALIPFPEVDAQRQGVQRFLDDALSAKLCVRTGTTPGMFVAEVSLQNTLAGHGFPSGSAQDRRVWVELHAYRGAEEVFSIGRVGANEIVPVDDPNMFVLHDTLFGADGKVTHNFWEATRFESKQLAPPLRSPRPGVDRVQRKSYPLPSTDRVTMAVHMRSIDIDVVEDLLATGDLKDRSILEKIPTFTLASTQLEWTSGRGVDCVTK